MKQHLAIAILVFGIVGNCFCAPSDCEPAGIKENSLEAEIGDGFVILTWEPSPSRQCIDRYQISVFLKDEGDAQLLKNLDLNTSDARGVVVGELTNGLNYLFVVTAFNQFGSGLEEVEGTPGELIDGEVLPPATQVVDDSVPATFLQGA
eukprot:TRINITY_DN28448_c0_g1_i2.p1 TRINITY_DN28448_c0_g1~~TRINITY_DN28448_c0_g1_i2.p1  ORF type:complete len:149 (-),score=22.71 TRINITY_DN28448_c0_g1_i2:54-500(-)